MPFFLQAKNWLKHNYRIILLIAIIGYASFLRIYGLGLQFFRIDEGFSSYVSKYIALGSWTGTIPYYLHTWSQVLAFKLGGINQRCARIPSVIASIVTMILVYIVPYKLYKDKRIALLSVFLFGFLYREIAWARQARFYALLQLLFVGGITLITYRIKTKKITFFNRTIILIYLGILFHPFLYTVLAILIVTIMYQYHKAWNRKDLISRKYLFTWIILGALILHYVWMQSGGGGTSLPWNDLALGLNSRRYYFKSYNYHFLSELGIGYIIGLGGMVRCIYKKKYSELLLRVFPFVVLWIFLVMKGYTLHYRYALLMFPLLIRSGSSIMVEFCDKISKKYIMIYYASLFLLYGITVHRQFIPVSQYELDFTSPQSDFQAAYASIPDGQNIISGFPVLCDWYYASRGNCFGALKVDLLNNGGSESLKKLKYENYTHLPYIENFQQLSAKDTYYFVIDNMTNKRLLSPEIHQYIIKNGQVTFKTLSGYQLIVVYVIHSQ